MNIDFIIDGVPDAAIAGGPFQWHDPVTGAAATTAAAAGLPDVGKYQPGVAVPSDSGAASSAMNFACRRNWLQRPVIDAVSRLRPLAEQAGLSLAQFALAWVLREPNVASGIVGASRPEQLDENAAASDARVDPALFAQAEEILHAANAVEM